MDDDFIRCYIGDISLITLRDVQRESGKFSEWELLQGAEFDHKHSYGHKEIFDRDELLLEALAKRSVIAETRQPESVKKSILWTNALNIADVLTLLSLARARYYPTLAVEKNLGQKYSIGWGLMAEEVAGRQDIILISKLGSFISETLTFFEKNPSWLEESGFKPSIYWYEQAQASFFIKAPSVLEMALHWVSIEIIAGTYIKSIGINEKNKKERVKRFISDKGYTGNIWVFLDEVIDDWYKTRNAAFHEGKQSLSVNVLTKRRQQVRDFTSLVLVEMLQQQDEPRKQEIATRMQNY